MSDTGAPVKVPFVVGQIVRETIRGGGAGYVATVTAVRDDPPEFDYVYPCSIPMVPRWGWSMTGGTALAAGFAYWTTATQAELDAFARSWDLSHLQITVTSINTPPNPCSST